MAAPPYGFSRQEDEQMNADERAGLWPRDLHARADAVMTFIVGHVAVQDQLDARPGRDLADWIALVSGDVGGPRC
jgi:hypothetical protein